jgi:hypothetical protein
MPRSFEPAPARRPTSWAPNRPAPKPRLALVFQMRVKEVSSPADIRDLLRIGGHWIQGLVDNVARAAGGR